MKRSRIYPDSGITIARLELSSYSTVAEYQAHNTGEISVTNKPFPSLLVLLVVSLGALIATQARAQLSLLGVPVSGQPSGFDTNGNAALGYQSVLDTNYLVGTVAYTADNLTLLQDAYVDAAWITALRPNFTTLMELRWVRSDDGLVEVSERWDDVLVWEASWVDSTNGIVPIENILEDIFKVMPEIRSSEWSLALAASSGPQSSVSMQSGESPAPVNPSIILEDGSSVSVYCKTIGRWLSTSELNALFDSEMWRIDPNYGDTFSALIGADDQPNPPHDWRDIEFEITIKPSIDAEITIPQIGKIGAGHEVDIKVKGTLGQIESGLREGSQLICRILSVLLPPSIKGLLSPFFPCLTA